MITSGFSFKLVCLLFYSFLIISCNKKNNAGENSSEYKISGTYKGGTLSWNKTTSNLVQTSGTDPNAEIKVTIPSTDKINLTLVTNANVPSTKTYTLPLTIRNENSYGGDYTYEMVEVNPSLTKKTKVIIMSNSTTTQLIFTHIWEPTTFNSSFSHLELVTANGYK